MKARINENGLFLANLTEEYIKEGYLMLDVAYTGSFRIPVWNGTEFIEDIPVNELNEIETSSLTIEVMSTVNYLATRALSSSIGKSGNRSELEAMKTIYQEKYNVAKGLIINTNMVQTITDEMNRDYPTIEDLDAVLTNYGITPTGTKLERFYQFIIFRYETGVQFHQFFISLVEDFRTCALTHVEKLRFDKARMVIEIAKALPPNVTQAELIQMRNQMFAI